MANENALPFDPGKVSDLIKQGKIKVVSTPNLSRHEAPDRIHKTSEFTEARGIMGDEFFGPDEIHTAFGYDIDRSLIPEIPFSSQELEEARKSGNQFLILYMPKSSDGAPITMERLHVDLTNAFEVAGKGKVLYDPTWYQGENFYTNDTPRPAWKLVTKDVIPGSTNHNYLQQTNDIATHLSDSVAAGGRSLPPEYWGAVGELTAQYNEIEGLMSSDWQEAAKRLAALKLNQMYRQTPVEALYADMVYFQNKNERLLETMYAWTNTQTSDGGLVSVGYADTGGVSVADWDPGDSSDSIGVVLSR